MVLRIHGLGVEEVWGCLSLWKVAIAGGMDSSISIVISMADVRHQAQVAPMTKGSRNVR